MGSSDDFLDSDDPDFEPGPSKKRKIRRSPHVRNLSLQYTGAPSRQPSPAQSHSWTQSSGALSKNKPNPSSQLRSSTPVPRSVSPALSRISRAASTGSRPTSPTLSSIRRSMSPTGIRSLRASSPLPATAGAVMPTVNAPTMNPSSSNFHTQSSQNTIPGESDDEFKTRSTRFTYLFHEFTKTGVDFVTPRKKPTETGTEAEDSPSKKIWVGLFKCNHCGQVIKSYRRSATAIRTHLKSMHPEIYVTKMQYELEFKKSKDQAFKNVHTIVEEDKRYEEDIKEDLALIQSAYYQKVTPRHMTKSEGQKEKWNSKKQMKFDFELWKYYLRLRMQPTNDHNESIVGLIEYFDTALNVKPPKILKREILNRICNDLEAEFENLQRISVMKEDGYKIFQVSPLVSSDGVHLKVHLHSVQTKFLLGTIVNFLGRSVDDLVIEFEELLNSTIMAGGQPVPKPTCLIYGTIFEQNYNKKILQFTSQLHRFDHVMPNIDAVFSQIFFAIEDHPFFEDIVVRAQEHLQQIMMNQGDLDLLVQLVRQDQPNFEVDSIGQVLKEDFITDYEYAPWKLMCLSSTLFQTFVYKVKTEEDIQKFKYNQAAELNKFYPVVHLSLLMTELMKARETILRQGTGCIIPVMEGLQLKLHELKAGREKSSQLLNLDVSRLIEVFDICQRKVLHFSNIFGVSNPLLSMANIFSPSHRGLSLLKANKHETFQKLLLQAFKFFLPTLGVCDSDDEEDKNEKSRRQNEKQFGDLRDLLQGDLDAILTQSGLSVVGLTQSKSDQSQELNLKIPLAFTKSDNVVKVEWREFVKLCAKTIFESTQYEYQEHLWWEHHKEKFPNLRKLVIGMSPLNFSFGCESHMTDIPKTNVESLLFSECLFFPKSRKSVECDPEILQKFVKLEHAVKEGYQYVP